jgi:hypothetical protein
MYIGSIFSLNHLFGSKNFWNTSTKNIKWPKKPSEAGKFIFNKIKKILQSK